ncbi:MAG: DHA2 family efflux MFS transporter permease subunit, partial [Alphaproteobacteria bacterium]|nr:DHA2 family efflux MFS transporter permease subunit [Alphaproteobacteria bacterium]
QHARAMAIWGMGVMLAPVVGPTLGGYLTHSYSWRWVFYINVPIGLLAIAGAIVFLARSRPDPAAKGFDWLGFAALGVGFGSLQAMLDRGERLDWFQSGEILIEGCLVALGLYLFAVHGLMAKHPLVNLRLFRDRNYFLGVMFIFLYGLLTLAPMVLLPPFLQGLQGYPITTVGMLLAPRGLGMMLAMVLFGRLGDKYDPRIGLAFGFLGLSVSSWAMSGWTLEVGFWDVAWTGFVQGVGAGIIVAPLGMMTFATLDIRHRTEASSVWNLVRSLGSSIGVAIALAILVRMSSTSQAVLTEHINPYNKLFTSGGGLPLPGAGGLALLDLEIGRQAAMIGYVDVFYLSAIASLLAIPLVPLLRRPPPATGP